MAQHRQKFPWRKQNDVGSTMKV